MPPRGSFGRIPKPDVVAPLSRLSWVERRSFAPPVLFPLEFSP